MWSCLKWLIFLLGLDAVNSIFIPPERHGKPDFYRGGDLLIGYIDGYTWAEGGLCDLTDLGVTQAAQGVQYFLEEVIGKDPSILPNITVGMVALDTCWEIGMGFIQAAKCVPLDNCVENCCKPEEDGVRGCYDVVGLVTQRTSTENIALSPFISQYKIPHISIWATNDELSNKDKYPFFSRTVPSDKFQAEAMIDLVRHFNWTYVSVVYYNTDYSRDGTNNILRLAKGYGICVAYQVEIRNDADDDDLNRVARALLATKKAKVVLAFTEQIVDLSDAIARLGGLGKLTFLTSDGASIQRVGKHGINFIKLEFSKTPDRPTGFESVYKHLPAWGSKPEYSWNVDPDRIIDCALNASAVTDSLPSCWSFKTMADMMPTLKLYSYHRRITDAVKAIVLGLHNLITANCPEAFVNKEQLRPCIKGTALLEHIRNVSFDGYGHVKVQFDAKGDGYPSYTFYQLQWYPDGDENYSYVHVASWVPEGLKIVGGENQVAWFDRLGPNEFIPADIPESVCAKPCKVGEFYIQGEVKCCWECRRCRDNEMIREDHQGCVQCPQLTWPDRANFTSCLFIPPTYMLWLDPIAFALCSLATLGIISTLTITYVFVRYREKKVIKGSSMEQMMTIIVALLMSHVTIFLLVMKPNEWGCRTSYVTFHSSCTLIFVPLLLKTTRLYRIFAAAEKCQQDVKYVSRQALIVFSVILLIILVSRPRAKCGFTLLNLHKLL